MNKQLHSLGLLLLFLILTACTPASTEGKKVFIAESNGMQIEMHYDFNGDQVIKQTTINTIPYTALGVSAKEDAQELIEDISQQYQGIEGLTETLIFDEMQVIETIQIDYLVVNLTSLQDIPGMAFSGDTSKAVSLKQSEKILLEQGFKELKQ